MNCDTFEHFSNQYYKLLSIFWDIGIKTCLIFFVKLKKYFGFKSTPKHEIKFYCQNESIEQFGVNLIFPKYVGGDFPKTKYYV